MARLRRLLELRDDAINAAESAHNRIRFEQAVYHSMVDNGMYKEGSVRIGKLTPLVAESLDPKITSAINRLIPIFVQHASKIEVFPTQYQPSQLEILHSGSIERWKETLDNVSSDTDQLRSLVSHNLICGNTICKTSWDAERYCYRSVAIDPTTFYPDPNASQIDLTDHNYVVHHNRRSGLSILMKYGIDMGEWRGIYDIYEIWMKRKWAEWCGVKGARESKTPLVRLLLIEDDVKKATSNPFWYPGYPFSCWRNFHLMRGGHSQSFWGFGYGTLLWPQQKLLDEVWANIVYIARRLSTGRLITNEGVLDHNKNYLNSGLVIEVNEDHTIDEIKEMPTEQIPAALFSIVSMLVEAMNQQVPSNTPSFVGEAPFQGASGKAINQLQSAAFTQLGENLQSFDQFRLRRARQKIALIQQFANRPLAPHAWREGVDLPTTIHPDARYTPCHPRIRDASMFADTIAGKLQMLQMMMQSGYVIAPDKLIELFNLYDTFAPDDIIPPQPQLAGDAQGGANPVPEYV